MSYLTERETQSAQSWVSQVSGCTCPSVFNGFRYVVERHTCEYCQEWAEKQKKLGITDTPLEAPKESPKRKRSSRAMRRAA